MSVKSPEDRASRSRSRPSLQYEPAGEVGSKGSTCWIPRNRSRPTDAPAEPQVSGSFPQAPGSPRTPRGASSGTRHTAHKGRNTRSEGFFDPSSSRTSPRSVKRASRAEGGLPLEELPELDSRVFHPCGGSLGDMTPYRPPSPTGSSSTGTISTAQARAASHPHPTTRTGSARRRNRRAPRRPAPASRRCPLSKGTARLRATLGSDARAGCRPRPAWCGRMAWGGVSARPCCRSCRGRTTPRWPICPQACPNGQVLPRTRTTSPAAARRRPSGACMRWRGRPRTEPTWLPHGRCIWLAVDRRQILPPGEIGSTLSTASCTREEVGHQSVKIDVQREGYRDLQPTTMNAGRNVCASHAVQFIRMDGGSAGLETPELRDPGLRGLEQLERPVTVRGLFRDDLDHQRDLFRRVPGEVGVVSGGGDQEVGVRAALVVRDGRSSPARSSSGLRCEVLRWPGTSRPVASRPQL